MVYLKVKRFQQQLLTGHPPIKLSPKYCKPFLVASKVGKVAYIFQLPGGVGIHLVFHVSFLK